jgi:hypothetical protein
MSWRVSLRIHYDRRSGLVALLTGVLLLVALLATLAWGQREAAASSPRAPLVYARDRPLAASTSMRQYYLSGPILNATYALTACANGYHMASLWEILDTSNLKYDASLGVFQGDSGSGPPTVWQGWVRTGYGSDNSSTAGVANCMAWTSTSGEGTTAGLPANWTGGLEDIHVWAVSTASCAGPGGRVWCVEDTIIYLPLIMRNYGS